MRVKRVIKKYSIILRERIELREYYLCSILLKLFVFLFLLCIYFFITTIRMNFL